MKGRKAKNRQLVYSIVLILALAAVVLLVQFDPTGRYFDTSLDTSFDTKYSTEQIVVDSAGDSEQETSESLDLTTEQTSVINQPPQIIIDPQDLTNYSTQNIESDADYSLSWPATQTTFNIHFKVEDTENNPVGLPSATDAAGNALRMAMSIDRPEYPNLIVLTETPTNPITISVTENPNVQMQSPVISRLKVYIYGGPQAPTIDPVLDIYLEDDPDFRTGPYPVNSNIVFNVENSTIDGQVMGTGTANILWALPDGTTSTAPRVTQSFSLLGKENVSVQLSIVQPSAAETETVEIEIYNGLNPLISTPEDGDEITLNEFIAFREASTSLSEPITSWVLDFGDESEPWGYLGIFGNQQACFSATNATSKCTSGIISDSTDLGESCACSSESTRIYPTTTIETTEAPGIRYHKYETVDDCGSDGVCTVNLTISSASYSASDSIDLLFDQPEAPAITNETPVNPCTEFPNLDICKPPVIDETFDPLLPDVAGQNNYVAQNPPANQDDFDPFEGLGDKPPEEPEGTGIGGIVITLLLLSALAGAGFFMWKKGMFSKLKLPGKSKTKPTSTLAATPKTSAIKDYISKAKAAGESDVVIRQNLKNAGWPEDEIKRNL